MSEVVLILGKPSSGKSSAIVKAESLGIKGLDPQKTLIIDVLGKGMPIKNAKSIYNKENKNYKATLNPQEIIDIINYFSNESGKKYLVLDDFQYIMSFQFMDDVENGKTAGSAVFERYNQLMNMSKNLFLALKGCKDDQIVFILSHSEEVNEGMGSREEMKLVGQATRKYMSFEGLVKIALFAVSEMKEGKPHKYFLTQDDGKRIARSPIGMFDDIKIKNDLGYVVEQIEKYN